MEFELNDLLYVVVNILNVNVEYMLGVLKEECNKYKEYFQDEVDFVKVVNFNFQVVNY